MRRSLSSMLLVSCTVLLMVLFALPIVLGLAGTLLPALGFTPVLAPGNGFAQVLEDPRFFSATLLTLKTGLGATFLVLVLSVVALVSLHNSRLWSWLGALMPPLLAVPHAAIAVGLVFLIAPSGALVRLISPDITGWTRPPDSWLVPDAAGFTLILGLLIKETPFLILTAAAHLPQLNVDASLQIGRSLGYSPARCWSRLILPQLYPRIRLPLLIILAFNLTVVDMALLLGPSNPPTLSVFLMSLVNDPGSRAAASAGAVLLALLVGLCFFAVHVFTYWAGAVARVRRRSGARGRGFGILRIVGKMLAIFMVAISIASLAVVLIWSITRRWRFPDAWPSKWAFDSWIANGHSLVEPAVSTLTIAAAAASLAMFAAIAWLELERRGHAPRLDVLWFIPLLIPQVSLLFGWQAMAYWTGVDGHWLTVVYSHWLYTMPYVVLILAVAWRELDPAWGHAANTLGAGYWRVLWRIRLPMLIKPLSQAMAVAIAVSVAQYLPTLLLGGGRHQTLAIELVTSFGGVDRRTIASLAVLQSLLPLLAFVLALFYPRWRGLRQRRGDALSSGETGIVQTTN
ncbi:MAG: ABC transporter permease [Granulosicoccus sp.]